MSRRLLAIVWLCGVPAFCEDAREIVREMQVRATTRSMKYEGSIRVTHASGQVNEKRWEYQRMGSSGASRVVIRFLAPPEVKGVGLLIVNHPDRHSDQWLWTPATGRERRIATQNRSTRVFGVDFSFEDLEERDVDQYDYRLAGEESVEDSACWRIEARPRKGKSSQYSYSLLWVRKDSYTLARMDHFIKERLVRRMRAFDLEKVQGIWTARRIEMSDFNRKSRSLLTIERLDYNVPFRADDFTLQALRR